MLLQTADEDAPLGLLHSPWVAYSYPFKTNTLTINKGASLTYAGMARPGGLNRIQSKLGADVFGPYPREGASQAYGFLGSVPEV